METIDKPVVDLFDLAASKGYKIGPSMLMIYDLVTWLREIHDIHCFALPVTAQDGERLYSSWTEYEWCTPEDSAKNDDQPYFRDYFDALEDAIKDGLIVLDRKP